MPRLEIGSHCHVVNVSVWISHVEDFAKNLVTMLDKIHIITILKFLDNYNTPALHYAQSQSVKVVKLLLCW